MSSRLLRVMPPPNSSSTPQSVLAATSFQVTRPMATTVTAAASATTVSGATMPKVALIWVPMIHAMAVMMNTSMVSTRGRFQGMGSPLTSIFIFRFGRSTTYIENSTSGVSASIMGRPYFIQPAKSRSSALAAMALGGEPTSEPRPPTLEA